MPEADDGVHMRGRINGMDAIAHRKQIRNRSALKKYRENPEKFRARSREHTQSDREREKVAGEALSENNRGQFGRIHEPDLIWRVWVAMPFDHSFSKNQMYARTGSGAVYIRENSRNTRFVLKSLIKKSVLDAKVKVAHNKVWITIFVEKRDWRGDAVNTVDLVCDAIKDAIGVDDKMFSIQQVDWAVVKRNPRILIGIGQESAEDVKVCPACGTLRPLHEFRKHTSQKLGVSGSCVTCRKT